MSSTNLPLFHAVAQQCSRFVTKQYSTSFSLAIRLLDKEIRQDIYNIYGFVRLADEIVDTFHGFDKAQLLEDFQVQTFAAIKHQISLNPVLHSFQVTVNRYSIDRNLIRAFFRSMEMDLLQQEYDFHLLKRYVYGSAEVVGLMCLTVFLNGDKQEFERLADHARALGSAFQKINFLRDVRQDMEMNRAYYGKNLDAVKKKNIEEDIRNDLQIALAGIKQLPANSRLAVFTAFQYYQKLFRKIQRGLPRDIYTGRIRIPNVVKYIILTRAFISNFITKPA